MERACRSRGGANMTNNIHQAPDGGGVGQAVPSLSRPWNEVRDRGQNFRRPETMSLLKSHKALTVF